MILENLSLDVLPRRDPRVCRRLGAGKVGPAAHGSWPHPKRSGTIKLFGIDLDEAKDAERVKVDMRVGVLFQHGALFSALTVMENIQVPMREYLDLRNRSWMSLRD